MLRAKIKKKLRKKKASDYANVLESGAELER